MARPCPGPGAGGWLHLLKEPLIQTTSVPVAALSFLCDKTIMANTWPLFFTCDQAPSLMSELNVLFYRLQSGGSMQLSTLSSQELGLPRGPEHPPALLYLLRVYQGSVGREGHRSHREQWLACLGPGLPHYAPHFWRQSRPLHPTRPGRTPGRLWGLCRLGLNPKPGWDLGNQDRAPPGPARHPLTPGAAHSPRGRIPKGRRRG